MKFATLACIIATASAAVGTDCSSDKTKCASTECCGVGKKDTSVNDNIATTDVTVCNTKDAKKFTDPTDNTKVYTFTCTVESTAAKTGSSQLVTGTAMVLAAAYYMA
mgnify:CR=1 FL=1